MTFKRTKSISESTLEVSIAQGKARKENLSRKNQLKPGLKSGINLSMKSI